MGAPARAPIGPVFGAETCRRRGLRSWERCPRDGGSGFLFQASLTEPELEGFLALFALVPARYFHPAVPAPAGIADYLPFATNMFLHGGWLHLVLNMWTLWIFGPAVEDRLGAGRYLAFYLATGLAASLSHAVFNRSSVIPALGASGAISGVIGCYVRLFPMARLVVLCSGPSIPRWARCPPPP
jgi:membrane associated rhomboid family serine protease